MSYGEIASVDNIKNNYIVIINYKGIARTWRNIHLFSLNDYQNRNCKVR